MTYTAQYAAVRVVVCCLPSHCVAFPQDSIPFSFAKVHGVEVKRMSTSFTKFVVIGDEIKTGSDMIRTYTANSDDQTVCDVVIFSTLAAAPKYINEPGCRREGCVTIDMPDKTGGADREVTVTMTVRPIDLGSGSYLVSSVWWYGDHLQGF
jgi:hypothetical protein